LHTPHHLPVGRTITSPTCFKLPASVTFLFHGPVAVVDVVAVAGGGHGETSLGLELDCSNRKRVARDYVSHASATTLDGNRGDGAERRLDGDDLIRCGELCTAVHVETVDHAVIAVTSNTW
jgi:hypothetical protein